ncbi:MAG: glutamate racemase [Acidobacteria bacterium]|nr:glutamate racemase [Acidobacteriota bacterium]MBV9145867.1 glutamate racemase [Acidobacteriota bacterium]MBV9436904.1 glutamate racemase [Acidobacteriota bacterium]
MKIGVFDSGFGGLTVLRELLAAIPGAEYLYVGDTARLPYGSKSAKTIAHYAVSSLHFLENQGSEYIVVACNTASALAMPAMKAAVTKEIVGVIEPGAQAASELSNTKNVWVIGTAATVASHAYRNELQKRGVRAVEKACPLLVPLVEEGWTEHPVTEQVARIYLNELKRSDEQAADVLVLGCTHYPLLKPLLHRVLPEKMRLVDSAQAVAHSVANRLGELALQANGQPSVQFFATDSVDKFRELGSRFLGREIERVELIALPE